jgi:riboflavin kinase/FMN adenylyltransferase
MEFIRGIHNIKPAHQGTVLTIGNFDGVHRGHRAVIDGAIARAKALGVPATVMLFEPQPMELFLKDKAPPRLYRLRDKYLQLAKLGVDQLLCVKFNPDFAGMTAMDFIEKLLVEKLAISHLIVGDDFCFGKNRQGDFDMLVAAGQRYGFNVNSTQSFRVEDCRISSTAIRKALIGGNFAEAELMLGHPFSINGVVTHGDKKGRTIGFPTANIALNRSVSPVKGVYVVTVKTSNGAFQGVANIGERPTVDGTQQRLEVHLFAFDKQIYGQHIEVILHQKLRDEQKFASLDDLKAQIALDVGVARNYFELPQAD